MKKMRTSPQFYRSILLLGLLLLVLSACAKPTPAPTLPPITETPSITPTPSSTPTPTSVVVFPGTAEGELGTATSTPGPIATPPPGPVITMRENLRVLLLAGQDSDSPYVGRTDAIMLILYDTLGARAGAISLAPDLLVNIPGFGAGRLNTAYALGGAQGLLNTITYNFGLTPDHYAVFNVDSFTKFVDQLGGVPIVSEDPVVKKCIAATPGTRPARGSEVLCVFRFRDGPSEIERNKRQGLVLLSIFQAMVRNGNLVRVPDLAKAYGSAMDSDLGYRDLAGFIPLALQIGDIDRFKTYTLPEGSLSYQSFGSSPDSIFLVQSQDAYRALILKVAEKLSTPMPFSTYLATLQYMLQFSPTPTFTPRPTRTPTRTITPTPTKTKVPTATPTQAPTWGGN